MQDLNESLKKIKENSFSDVEKVMSKYYEKELKAIKANHNAEYSLIQDRELKIKANQDQIDKLNYELEKINREFDKKLTDKSITAEASKSFAADRQNLISKNNGVDLNRLLSTPVTEFERYLAQKKEDIDMQFSTDGDAEKRAKALKELAIEQNVFWGELSKGLVKGTKEYDTYTKNANDGFRDYKAAIKDSIEAQKQNKIETEKLTEKIEDLTDKNTDMQQEITTANGKINTDIDSLTRKFKNAAGDWITNINDARNALQGISSDAKAAVAELDKINKGVEVANNTKSIQATGTKTTTINTGTSNIGQYVPVPIPGIGTVLNIPINTPVNNSITTSNAAATSKTYKDNYAAQIKQGENFEQTIARWKMEEAQANKNIQKFKDGGISRGPESGYTVMHHGEELTLNSKQGNNLAWLYKQALNPQLPSSNNSQQNIQIHINGSGLPENQLTSAINKAFEQKRINKNMSYS